MIANYHTHTFRCAHAVGTEREYIEKAIKNGVKILGFSDHVPYPEESYAGRHRIRMHRADVPGYFETLTKLRDEYKNDIEIHIGFEAEYFPKKFAELKSFLSQFPTEYLILGQHFIGDEFGLYSGHLSDEEDLFREYIDECIEGMQTGDFTYLAHPDLCHIQNNDELFESEMRRLLIEAKKLNVPIEFNILGYHTNRHYPCEEFFNLVSEIGNPVVLGSDAHEPDDCGNRDYAECAEIFLSRFGIVPVETVEIKKINF